MTALEHALPHLLDHRKRLDGQSMRELFTDPNRFAHFSTEGAGLFLDYSKNRLDRDAFNALMAVAERSGVEEHRAAMLAGQRINRTEGRAVMHLALRAPRGAGYSVDGAGIMEGIQRELDHMLVFAEGVRTGDIAGSTEAFTDVINIGIGGSDLGPAMATIALRPYHDGPRVHFVSNVDGSHLADTIAGLDPKRTLILVASKTFTTVETMTNARTARAWIADAVGEDNVGAHLAAMSTASARMAEFGIPDDRRFGFEDWVGGRYSVWSVIGLPLAIAIGPERFRAFLAGAHAMDRHFETAPLSANLPVIMAMIGVWHRNICGFPALAVLPYDERLRRFPAYLQQLDMESNGKRVTLDGHHVALATGPLVFGEPGTNGQHAFYQFIHQGTDVTPCDFLLAAEGHEGRPEHHDQLVAACLAQAEALMRGKTEDEARTELAGMGYGETEIDYLALHKTFPGNRPSNLILYDRLDPSTLGQLIALYEHKVFVQGIVWNINSFDQWGVELGKQLASGLLGAVRSGDAETGSNSTAGLIARIARLRNG